jgi:hypothetical protein
MRAAMSKGHRSLGLTYSNNIVWGWWVAAGVVDAAVVVAEMMESGVCTSQTRVACAFWIHTGAAE